MPWKNDQVSEKETKIILEAAKNALETAAEGDFVEFGCYRGDTSLLLAEILRNNPKEPKRRLWLYDSFEGLPEKTTPDYTEKSPEFEKGALTVSKREVKLRFLHANLPAPVIKKAWFENLTPEDLPEKISFAFLDGDFYNSIKTSLNLIFPKLTENSTIIIHDYSNEKLPGVAKATDEFFLKNQLTHNKTLIKL